MPKRLELARIDSADFERSDRTGELQFRFSISMLSGGCCLSLDMVSLQTVLELHKIYHPMTIVGRCCVVLTSGLGDTVKFIDLHPMKRPMTAEETEIFIRSP